MSSVFLDQDEPFGSLRSEFWSEGSYPGIPGIFLFFFQPLEPAVAEGDVVDFVAEDLRHELGAFNVAEVGERLAVEGREVEIGHLEGEAHHAYIFDRRGEVGDMVPEMAVEGEIAEMEAELFHPLPIKTDVSLLLFECVGDPFAEGFRRFRKGR